MRDLVQEQHERDKGREREEKAAARTEARRQITCTKNETINAGEVKRLERELKNSFLEITFSSKAIERLYYYKKVDHDLYCEFLEHIKQLSIGQLVAKHDVPRTTPRLWQHDCGNQGKLYYRKQEQTRASFVALIGTENSGQ